jgi:LPXTG-motif cell wall-anchored protein
MDITIVIRIAAGVLAAGATAFLIYRRKKVAA